VKGWELYDLGFDVSETHNRASDHPDVVRRLESQAGEFYRALIRNQRPIGRVTP
jgi:hypothetical protein